MASMIAEKKRKVRRSEGPVCAAEKKQGAGFVWRQLLKELLGNLASTWSIWSALLKLHRRI